MKAKLSVISPDVCGETAIYWASCCQSDQVRLVINVQPQPITVVLTRGFPLYCEKGISVPIGLNDKEVLGGLLLRDVERLGQSLSLFYSDNERVMAEHGEEVETYGPMGPIFNTAALPPTLIEVLDDLWVGDDQEYLRSDCYKLNCNRPRLWKNKVNNRTAIVMKFHIHPVSMMVGMSGKFAVSFDNWNPSMAEHPDDWVESIVSDGLRTELYGLDHRIAEWRIREDAPLSELEKRPHSIITLPIDLQDIVETRMMLPPKI